MKNWGGLDIRPRVPLSWIAWLWWAVGVERTLRVSNDPVDRVHIGK